MKTAMLLLSLVGLLALPATIYAVAPDAEITPLLGISPSAGGFAVARLVVNHQGDPIQALLRIENENGVPVAQRALFLAEGTTTLEAGVAPGKYVTSLTSAGITGISQLDTTRCESGIAQANLHTTRETQLVVLGSMGIRVAKSTCDEATTTPDKTYQGELLIDAATRKGLPAYFESGTNTMRFHLDEAAQRVVIRATWIPTTTATGTLNIETSSDKALIQQDQGNGRVEYTLGSLAAGNYYVAALPGGIVTANQRVNVEVLVNN